MREISFTELLSAALPGIRQAAETEWTERDWQQSMRRASLDMAHEILKGCKDLPRLQSVVAPEDGVSAFIVMESDNAQFTITVTTARKAEPMDPEPVAPADDDRCVFCGRVHANATTRAMADEKYLKTGEAAQNTPDEPVKPWPAWGESKSE